MSALLFVLACALPAFLTSLLATAAARRWAPRFGLIDQPAARKVHTTPIPLGGGIGIYLGVVVPLAAATLLAFWIARQSQPPAWLPETWSAHIPGALGRSGQLWALLAAGTLLMLMGLLDDLKGLPWQLRLGVQFLLAVALTFSGVRASLFVDHPWVGQVVTVIWIIVLINAFNFLDNMDALSGGIGLIAAVLFAAVMLSGRADPRWLVGGCLIVLAGSLAGFLVHNRPPARIFMGDTGSTFLGLMLASLTVLGTFYEPDQASRHVILAPLCVLAVPLYDFTSVVLIRFREGRSPFHPDKCHFSHRLTDLGLTKPRAVLTVHLATLTTGLGALLLYQVPGWGGALLVVALVLCVLTIIAILETVGRRRNSH